MPHFGDHIDAEMTRLAFEYVRNGGDLSWNPVVHDSRAWTGRKTETLPRLFLWLSVGDPWGFRRDRIAR
jgi:hypothetical protein